MLAHTELPVSEKPGIFNVKSPLLREGNGSHYHREIEYHLLRFDGPFEDREA